MSELVFSNPILQVTFAFIYFVGFVVYASLYSSKMQQISRTSRMLKIPGIDVEKLKLKIKRRQESAAFLKMAGWAVLLLIFTVHIALIVLSTRNTLFDLLSTFCLFVLFLILMIIINWLKGAGTIDSNARMHRNAEF